MKKAAPIAFVLAAMLVLAGSAGGRTAATKPAKFVGVSHTHPAGESTSWVCAKIKKITRAKASLRVRGPGASVSGETYVVTLRGTGTKLVSFEINRPGTYTFRLTIGKTRITKTYPVPDPPDPAQGPFACPQS